MKGWEHYRQAEAIADRANGTEDREQASVMFQNAQVHATLALAAATALQPREFLTVDYRDQIALPWLEVAG